MERTFKMEKLLQLLHPLATLHACRLEAGKL